MKTKTRARSRRAIEGDAHRAIMRGVKALAAVHHITPTTPDAELFEYFRRAFAWVALSSGLDLRDPRLAPILSELALCYTRDLATRVER